MNAKEDQIEKEANYFAMHLLVPSALLRPLLQKNPIDITGDGEDVKKLAKKFGVSTNVMMYRIAEECA